MDQTINYRRKILFYAAASSCASVYIARGERAHLLVSEASTAARCSRPSSLLGPPLLELPPQLLLARASRACPRASQLVEPLHGARRARRLGPRASACSPSPAFALFGAGSVGLAVGGLGGPAPQLKGAAGEKFTILSRRKLIRARAPATGASLHRPLAALSLCVWCGPHAHG